MARWRRPALVALLLAWVAAVLVAYYYVHKPLRLSQARALLEAAVNLLTSGLIVSLAGGLGWRWSHRLQLPSGGERLAWSAGLGLGVLALVTLFVGAEGGYRPWIAWLLVLVAALIWRRETLAWLQLAWRSLRAFRPRGRWEWALVVYLAAGLILALLLGLLPPTAWDGLVYHLTGPKLYIEAEKLAHPIDLFYLGFPALGEMLFTLAMLLRGPVAAQLISFWSALLLAAGLYGFCRRHWERPAALLAVAVLYSGNTMLLLASWPYVDVLLMLASLGALVLFLDWMRAPTRPRLLAAALFISMTVGLKYTGVIIPAGLVLLWLVTPSSRRPAWGQTLVLAGLSALFALPWALKNWALTGNPVYPFFFPGIYSK